MLARGPWGGERVRAVLLWEPEDAAWFQPSWEGPVGGARFPWAEPLALNTPTPLRGASGLHGISRLGVWLGLWPLRSWVPAQFAHLLVK